MLKLNVWTPSLTGKRAVMVYFHGGGFSFGSSYELPRTKARRWRGITTSSRCRSITA